MKIAGPQPLRTDQQPDGVKYMSYVNKIRVSQANILYKFVTDVALFCIDAGMIVAIENPRASLYWKTSFFAPLRKYLKFTEHQACAYGSERPKWTALAHNTVALTKLCKCCLVCPANINISRGVWSLAPMPPESSRQLKKLHTPCHLPMQLLFIWPRSSCPEGGSRLPLNLLRLTMSLTII